jgi:hypothetical protein
MFLAVERNPAAAGNDKLQPVKGKISARERVIRITLFAPAHHQGQRLRARRRQVEKKISCPRNLFREQRGGFLRADIIHVVAASIHFLKARSSAFSGSSLADFL